MKNYALFLIIALSGMTFFSSCTKDDDKTPTGFQVTFKAVYDGEAISDKIPYNDGDILLTKFMAFLTNIEIKDEDQVIGSKDYALLSLIDETQLFTYTLEGSSIPFKDMDEITFDIGIPAHLNAKKPSDYESDHILSDNGNYWDAWGSYIFSKTEGKFIDSEGKQTGFAFHTGADETFTPVTLSFDDDYDFGSGLSIIEVEVDLKELFEGDDDLLIDLKTQNGFHESDEIEAMKEWNKKLADAISIKQ